MKLAVPFVRITGAAGVIPGVGRIASQGAAQSASGLGDIVVSGTYGAYYDRASRAGVRSASLGVSHALDARNSAGVNLDTRQPVSASSAAQRELMAFWIFKIDQWKLQAYVLLGFANGSPDQGTGLSFARPF